MYVYPKGLLTKTMTHTINASIIKYTYLQYYIVKMYYTLKCMLYFRNMLHIVLRLTIQFNILLRTCL